MTSCTSHPGMFKVPLLAAARTATRRSRGRLFGASLSAPDESPRGADAEERLRQCSGACPESPISLPLTVQALLFEEGREKEEAPTIQVLTKKDEALPAAPIVRKLRGKITLNTGRGG